jgi:Na+/H+ antiporter NhaC
MWQSVSDVTPFTTSQLTVFLFSQILGHGMLRIRAARRYSVLALLLSLLGPIGCNHSNAEEQSVQAQNPVAPVAFEVAEPRSLPNGSSVPRLRLIALDGEGQRNTAWSGDVKIQGLLIRGGAATAASPWENIELTTQCEDGQLIITPDSFDGSDFSISTSGIEVSVVLQGATVVSVTSNPMPLSSWFRLLPPLVAIGLAIAIQDVNVALLLATFSGCLLYFGGTDIPGAFNMLCATLMHQVADTDHASVILFTVFLGAMIGLMNDSGGTQTVVDRLATFAGTRRRGQFLTWVMGLVVFFDDYANTLLIGGAMRPLSDRLKISREKLAFLIDSTAAPIAGIAIVSTWVGFEIDQIEAGLIAGSVDVSGDRARAAASLFYQSIPYRFYPIIALGMVAVIALSGRDFGPMRKAENTASADDTPLPNATVRSGGSVWFAILPVVTLVGLVIACFAANVDSYRLLLIASLLASIVAFLLPALSRSMTFEECSKSWTAGVGSMIPAVIVLVLAWAVSNVCRPETLDTAGLIISWVGDSVSVNLMPSIAFVVAGAIAFSIGSSFTTMALLTPLFIPLCWSLLVTAGAASVGDPIFLGTIGAVLAGAIFGDHCSPISDTTVLSSAAAGCNHLAHVTTQMPYALTAAGCSLLLCYLPIGYGLPWWIALPVGLIATGAIIMILGKTPDTEAVDRPDSGDHN